MGQSSLPRGALGAGLEGPRWEGVGPSSGSHSLAFLPQGLVNACGTQLDALDTSSTSSPPFPFSPNPPWRPPALLPFAPFPGEPPLLAAWASPFPPGPVVGLLPDATPLPGPPWPPNLEQLRALQAHHWGGLCGPNAFRQTGGKGLVHFAPKTF